MPALSPTAQLVAAIEADELSPEKLHELAHYRNNYRVRAAVARSSIAMPKTYALLTLDQSPTVINDLMGNRRLPVLTINLLMLDFTDEAYEFARHSRDTETLLPIFANSKNDYIKNRVAQNPLATANILSAMAMSDDLLTGLAVALHENTDSATLTKMAAHPMWKVRHNLATNPHTPLAALALLLTDIDHDVAACAERFLTSFRRTNEIKAHLASNGIDIDHEDLPIELLVALL
jgi:hypothetical protein